MYCSGEDLQGQVADLNLLQEKMATSTDASQMEAQLESVLVDNERQSRETDDLFDSVKTAKERVAHLERDIQQVYESSAFHNWQNRKL